MSGEQRTTSSLFTSEGDMNVLRRVNSAPALFYTGAPDARRLSSNPISAQAQNDDTESEHHSTPTVSCILLMLIGGLMIGYALNFPGGLPKMDVFLRRFSHSIFIAKKKAVKNNFCYYSNGWLLLFTSLIPLCALPAIWLGLLLACRWGRKPTLMLGSGFWILGACLGTWFPSTSIGVVGMLFLGLGLGFTWQVIPMIYLEVVPPDSRDRIDILFQYMMSLGNVLACMVNFIASYYPAWGWRLSYGFVALLAFTFLFVTWHTRETPKWLFQHGKWMRATSELRRMRESDFEVAVELAVMAKEGHQDTEQLRDATGHRSRPILVISLAAQFFQQLIGTGSLIFFGPILLESLDYTLHQAFLGPLCASICSILASIAYTCLLDRVGRRIPLIWSCITIFGSQLFIWVVYYLDGNVNFHLSKPDAVIFLILMVSSVLSYGVLSAPHGWIDDKYHGEGKALGAAVETSIYIVMLVVMTQITLRLFCGLSIWIFIYLAIIALSIGGIIFFFIPETTGIMEHEISRRIWSQHWYWRRFFPDHLA